VIVSEAVNTDINVPQVTDTEAVVLSQPSAVIASRSLSGELNFVISKRTGFFLILFIVPLPQEQESACNW
jgi:hypothetical protein